MQVTCNSFQPGLVSPCTRVRSRARVARPICSGNLCRNPCQLCPEVGKIFTRKPATLANKQAGGILQKLRSLAHKTSYSRPGVTCERITRIMRTRGGGGAGAPTDFYCNSSLPPRNFSPNGPVVCGVTANSAQISDQPLSAVSTQTWFRCCRPA